MCLRAGKACSCTGWWQQQHRANSNFHCLLEQTLPALQLPSVEPSLQQNFRIGGVSSPYWLAVGDELHQSHPFTSLIGQRQPFVNVSTTTTTPTTTTAAVAPAPAPARKFQNKFTSHHREAITLVGRLVGWLVGWFVVGLCWWSVGWLVAIALCFLPVCPIT